MRAKRIVFFATNHEKKISYTPHVVVIEMHDKKILAERFELPYSAIYVRMLSPLSYASAGFGGCGHFESVAFIY